MKRLFWVCALLAIALPCYANESVQGWCERGSIKPIISGLTSVTNVQGSYPQCTVTVYNHDTIVAATIYSDNAIPPTLIPGGSFTATTLGRWQFYAGSGFYDVVLSGAGFPAPFTISNLQIPGLSTTFNIVDYGAKCDGSTNDYASINYARSLAAAQSTGGTVLIPANVSGGCVLGSSITFDSNVTVRYEGGAQTVQSNAVTATFDGCISAPPSQIFSGAGNVVVSSPCTSHVFPQWWGAKGNNSNDDTAAINAAAVAVEAFGGTLYFPPGDYSLNTQNVADGNGYAIYALSNIRFCGSGINATRLNIIVANTSIFYSRLATHFEICDLSMTFSSAAVNSNADCIKLLSGQFFSITNTECNNSRIGYQMLGDLDGIVSGNFARNQNNDSLGDDARGFDVGNDGGTASQRISLVGNSSISSQTHGFVIFGNAADIALSDNHAIGCADGSGFRIDTGVRAQVSNNEARSCSSGIHSLSASGSQFSNNLVIGNLTYGIWLTGAQQNTFSGGLVVDNGVGTSNTYDGIFLEDNGSTGSILNTFEGVVSRNSAGSTQRYGFNDSGTNSGQNIVSGEFENNATGSVVIKSSDDYRSRVNNIMAGTFSFSNVITPTISGNQNDYNPTGFSGAGIMIVTLGGVSRTITGFVAPTIGVSGRGFYIFNADSGADLTLSNNSGSSSSSNRIYGENNADVVVHRNSGLMLIYDSATGANHWRAVTP